MLHAESFDYRNSARESGNPYASDRATVSAEERLIEKTVTHPPVFNEISMYGRELSAEELGPMRSVKSGLQYYYSGIYLVTFCFFASAFLGPALGPQVTSLLSLGTTLGILIVLIGEIRCMAIPRHTGGFHHILLSVLFYTLGVLMYFVKKNLVANGIAPPKVLIQVGTLQLVFGFLANFFFLTFIICLTRYLEHQVLYRKAIKTRKAIWSMLGFVFVVMLVFLILVNQLPPKANQLAFVTLGLGTLGFVILVYSWLNRFTRLVQETYSAIALD